MEEISLKIDEIYVPVKRRQDIDPEKVNQIAESIMETGQQVPISVRWDGKRHILVSGLQRLEACQALGEEKIRAIVIAAPQH